jgi:2-polyprenyl-3-methyl-5-hydroxy-6-metoxy-1,4-benzoquinol methylase
MHSHPAEQSTEASPFAELSAFGERPDVDTSSADYARRFSGSAGRYLLDIQARAVAAALQGLSTGTALDVGGAHGQLLDPLRAAGWEVVIHGTDPRCAGNLRDRRGAADYEFLTGPLHRLPAADRSFDLVIAVRLLPHVTQWQRLLAEMCRVARRAVIVDYPINAGLHALAPALFRVKKAIERNTRTYASFSRADLEPQLRSQGFRCAREVRQFCLPMVLHRVGRAAWPLRATEQVCRASGLTAWIGSPVILRADRDRT